MPSSKTKKNRSTPDKPCCESDCCGPGARCCGLDAVGTCQVESVVTVDARGQMVLPKEVRTRFGLASDDKLAIVSWARNGQPCCLTLLKVNDLAEEVRRAYGPILREIVRA